MSKNYNSYNFPEPNEDLVNEYLINLSSDKKYKTIDDSISKLIENFPSNKLIEDIQLKVSVINNLYNTNIISTFQIAQHIHSLDIDKFLEEGDLSVVNKIAQGHNIKSKKTLKEFNFYSFATKYCHWHKNNLFPIYDKYIDFTLRVYNKDFKYNKTNNFKNYFTLFSTISEFRLQNKLESKSIKEIDKYLWYLGKKHLEK